MWVLMNRWIKWTTWPPYSNFSHIRDFILLVNQSQWGGYWTPQEWTKESRRDFIADQKNEYYKEWYQELENRSYQVARGVLEGSIPDRIYGRVYFHDENHGKPNWRRVYSHDFGENYVPYNTP